jgi:hypothetical protein
MRTKAEDVMDAIDEGRVKGQPRKLREALAAADRTALVELLADVEHQKWGDWVGYFFGKLERLEDGRLAIPVAYEEALKALIDTPFADLSEEMKEADRREVRRYWPIIERFLAELA